MKDPKRYTLAEPDISYGMDESKKGEFVYWSDYARLKAEVAEARKGSGAGMKVMLGLSNELVAENARLKAENERLRASSFVTAVPVEEYEELKAENERLRKAVMHSPAAQLKLKELEGKTTYEEINAAKDGKPSE